MARIIVQFEIEITGSADEIRDESDWFDSTGRIMIDGAYLERRRSNEDDSFFAFEKYEIKD